MNILILHLFSDEIDGEDVIENRGGFVLVFRLSD